MAHTLLETARRYTEAHADANGVAETPILGLTLIRQTAPTALQYAINKPLVAMVLQGSKRVTMGSSTFDFGAGASLLITADVPTVSQITRANINVPYFSVVVDLDPAVIESLTVDMAAVPFDSDTPVRADPTEAEVADAALRLMRLLERPAMLPVLEPQLIRELHFWLLSGRCPRPRPASTTRSNPTWSRARRPTPLSSPQSVTAGSSAGRLKPAANTRSWREVAKPHCSAQAAIARVFFSPTMVESVRMEVLSVDSVITSMSCRTS